MSAVRHVIELRDDCSRELRVESNLNSDYMTVTIQDRKVILSPTAVKELWHFLSVNIDPIAEES